MELKAPREGLVLRDAGSWEEAESSSRGLSVNLRYPGFCFSDGKIFSMFIS